MGSQRTMRCLGPKRERCRHLGMHPCPLLHSWHRATEQPILEICRTSVGPSSSGLLACSPSGLASLSPDMIDALSMPCLSAIPPHTPSEDNSCSMSCCTSSSSAHQAPPLATTLYVKRFRCP